MNALEKLLQRSLLWSIIQVFVKRIFDFFVKLVLLNLLFPKDFGIVSMAVAFTSIIYVVSDLGFKNALIQKRDDELADIHYQSVFWFGILWALIVYAFVYYLGSDKFSNFYSEPLLTKIIPILTAPILIDSLTIVFRVKLFRLLHFKKIAIIQATATILSGFVTVVFALSGAGIWSLVLYLVFPYLCSLPLYLLLAKWKPKLIFSWSHLVDILRSSFFICLTILIIIMSSTLDVLFIGKLTDAHSLGIYSFALMFTVLLSVQITSMIDRVLYPFYSKVQQNMNLIKSYFLKSLFCYSVILYPIMLGLLLFSSPIIKLFFNKKWLAADYSIKILALVVLVKMLTHGSTLVYRSLGKPKLELKILASSLILTTLPAICIGSSYGILGVSVGILSATIINSFFYFYFLNKILSVSPIDVFKNLKAPLLGFIISFSIILPTYYFTKINFLFLLISLFVIYGYVIYYFHKIVLKKISHSLFQQ